MDTSADSNGMAVKEPPPMVYVVWEDAAVKDDGVWTTETVHKYEPALMRSVGFLLDSSEQGIIITHTWNPDCLATRDQIPIGMIRSMGLLEAAKPLRKKRT